MDWFKMSVHFADHPKVLALSDKAFRAHVMALCYVARHETDGLYSAAGVTPRYVQELVAAGLWVAVGAGYEVHDWSDFIPARTDMEALRELRREAGRKGGLAKGLASAKQGAKQTASKTPSKNVAEVEVEPELEEPHPPNPPSGGAYDDHPRFAEFWDAFPPPHTARRAAVRAFNAAVGKRKADPDVLIAAAARYAESPKVREGYVKAGSTWLNGDCWTDDPALELVGEPSVAWGRG